jgi:hypothetical protein
MMNRVFQYGATLPVAVCMVPVAGLTGGNAGGLNSVWLGAVADGIHEAQLAEAVAKYPLSNADLLASLEACRPPQTWYHEDHEGLY